MIDLNKYDMERDLLKTDWIKKKVIASEAYAQNLYAAMCNREFVPNDVWPRLKDERWSCSWRHSGGIIADMRGEGDYMNWYCSGIRYPDYEGVMYDRLSDEEKLIYNERKKYVEEGIVTEEIKNDLLKLGWIVLDEDSTD